MIDNHIKKIINAIKKTQYLGEDNDEYINKELNNFFKITSSEDYEGLRRNLARLSDNLHDIGTPAIPYLLFIFMKFSKKISTKKINTIEPFIGTSDPDIVMDTIKSIYNNMDTNVISMLDFELPIEINDIDTVYASLRDVLSFYNQQPIDHIDTESDINSRMMNYCISRELSKKLGCTNEFYVQYKGFIGVLNRQSYFQQARDFSENALICSFMDEYIEYGLLIYFDCFVQQRNIVDSLLFGITLLYKIDSELNEISDYIFNESVFVCFTLLRNFNFFDLAEDFYNNSLELLDLDEYHLQRLTNAYFYVLIMRRDSNALSIIESYICENYNSIIEYGNHSISPVYNLILQAKRIGGYQSTKLPDIENKLAIELGEELQGNTYYPTEGTDIKSMLISQVNKVCKTRDINDLVSETNVIGVTANSALRFAIKNNDIYLYLLSHLVMSDASLSLQKAPVLSSGLVSANQNFHIPDSMALNNYIDYVKSILNISNDYIYIWLSSIDNKIIALTYSNGTFSKIIIVDNCSMTDILEWKNKTYPNLGYNDEFNNNGTIESYRYIPQSFLDKLCDNFFSELPQIKIENIKDKSVVFLSNELSVFPPNLIQKSNKELISNVSSVITPLSFENYAKYRYEEIKISSNRIYLWAPIDEQDYAINMAYSKLKDKLFNYDVTFDNKKYPDSSIMSDINIFIAHGGSGHDGLRGIYPNSNEAYDVNTETIFATGKIAILFICHSGSSGKSLFFNKTNTLIKKLLGNGYNAVIAPFWSLNVKIPSVWTKELLFSLDQNMAIDISVFNANKAVQNEFILPTAWACMHLFGNNNIGK